MIKALIVDMDGTIFDTEQLKFKGWQTVLAKHGYNFTIEMHKHLLGGTASEIEKIFQEFFGKELNFKSIRDERIEWVDKYISANGVPLKLGARELLEFAKAHSIKRAVGTAVNSERVSFFFAKADLLDIIDVIVGTNPEEKGKDGIFKRAIEQ